MTFPRRGKPSARTWGWRTWAMLVPLAAGLPAAAMVDPALADSGAEIGDGQPAGIGDEALDTAAGTGKPTLGNDRATPQRRPSTGSSPRPTHESS